MKLDFEVIHQKLQQKNNEFLVSDSVNYLHARFNFNSRDWEGLTKHVVFKYLDHDKIGYNVILDDDNTCEVPAKVLENSYGFKMLVYGVDDTGYTRITTNPLIIDMEKCGFIKHFIPISDPTKDAFTDIYDKLGKKFDDIEYNKESGILVFKGDGEPLKCIEINGGGGSDNKMIVVSALDLDANDYDEGTIWLNSIYTEEHMFNHYRLMINYMQDGIHYWKPFEENIDLEGIDLESLANKIDDLSEATDDMKQYPNVAAIKKHDKETMADWAETDENKASHVKGKPQINSKDLRSGNNTLTDLGIAEENHVHTANEVYTDDVETLDMTINNMKSDIAITKSEKQDKLVDETGAGQNFAKLVINGETKHILGSEYDIYINTGGDGHIYIRVSETAPNIGDCNEGDIWLKPVVLDSSPAYQEYILTNTVSEGHYLEWRRLETNIDYTLIPELKDILDTLNSELSDLNTGLSTKQDKLHDMDDATGVKNVKRIKINGTPYSILASEGDMDDIEITTSSEGEEEIIVSPDTPFAPSFKEGTLWFKKIEEGSEISYDVYVRTLEGSSEVWKPFIPVVFDTKQDKLIDNGEGKNLAQLIIDGSPVTLLQDKNIVIPIGGGGHECIIVSDDEPDITTCKEGDLWLKNIKEESGKEYFEVRILNLINLTPVEYEWLRLEENIDYTKIPKLARALDKIIISKTEPAGVYEGQLWVQPESTEGSGYFQVYVYRIYPTIEEENETSSEWVKLEHYLDYNQLDNTPVYLSTAEPTKLNVGGLWLKQVTEGGIVKSKAYIKINDAGAMSYQEMERTLDYSKLPDLSSRLTNIDDNITTLGDAKQDKLVSGENISPIKLGDNDSKSLLNKETLNISAKINNKELIGDKLTSHDINVPLLQGEVIVNRLEPQTILVDTGVLWVDCRKIRLKTTENLVWILTATPTTEEPDKKTWVKYTGQSLFVPYEGDTPVVPDPSGYSVGSILVDHKPHTVESFANIYVVDLQDDDTTHYWKKLSSQDGYMKDPTKPSINGVNVAGARTSSSYGLQDKLEAGYNIKKIQVGESEPQSLFDNPDQPLVVGGGGGTSDYNSLVNLPEVNEKVLKGRLTSTDLNIPLTAEIGDCIIARNETYNPMLNVGTIWLDIFKIQSYDPNAARILEWKEMESSEKVWVDYDKTVHYKETHDPDYIPHDIPDEQEGDICVVWNDNYVPVFWKVFKLDKVEGSLKWRRMNLIYSYSQIPDKPVLNGHRFAGTQNARHYDIANLFLNTVPADLINGDFKVEQIGEGIVHNKLSMYNESLGVWEELIQCYSGGDFSPVLEERLSTIESKICTGFDKTSTNKSPSCKAIADYVGTVISNLDMNDARF